MEKKYRIGYTTGVFDLFHIGHLAILKKAKEQCSYLIVGVSSDRLAKEYKGKLPVIGLRDRMEIISAVRYVDEVVIQETMDKAEAWNKLHYDVLFHGDDWKGSKIYKDAEERLKRLGADVVYLPHTPGISSTMIEQMMRSDGKMNVKVRKERMNGRNVFGGGSDSLSFGWIFRGRGIF